MPVRLIVSDIDSTLLWRDHLPPANITAIQRAQAAGVQFMLATVRKYSSAYEIAQQLGITCPLICEGGATIYDATGTNVHSAAIDTTALHAIIAQADAHAIPLLFTRNGQNIAIAGAIQELSSGFDPHVHFIERLSDIDVAQPITRIIVAGAQHVHTLAPTIAALPVHFAKHYRRDGTLDDAVITAQQATKADAMSWWCARQRIDLSHVLAIGDAEADLHMLMRAGQAAAPANAVPAVQTAADWVGPLAEDGAVAAAIYRFLPHLST